MILLDLPAPLVHRISGAACAHNVSVEEQIVSMLNTAAAPPKSKLMTTEASLELALQRASKRATGDKFMLEDLFSDEEWELVPSRRAFGRQFRRRVESAPSPIAHYYSRTAANKAVYERY